MRTVSCLNSMKGKEDRHIRCVEELDGHDVEPIQVELVFVARRKEDRNVLNLSQHVHCIILGVLGQESFHISFALSRREILVHEHTGLTRSGQMERYEPEVFDDRVGPIMAACKHFSDFSQVNGWNRVQQTSRCVSEITYEIDLCLGRWRCSGRRTASTALGLTTRHEGEGETDQCCLLFLQNRALALALTRR